MRSFAIIGAGGFGREVAPMICSNNNAVFVSDLSQEQGSRINGRQVLSFNELTSSAHRHRDVVIAVSDPAARKSIVERCEAADLKFGSVLASTHICGEGVAAAEGLLACGFTTITSNVVIGRHCHLNLYSYVAHDCIVGDFVTISPRVSCNGWVEIGDGAFIGTGVTIRNGSSDRRLKIGKGAVLGMGAVVTKDVPPMSTVVGNPARLLDS